MKTRILLASLGLTLVAGFSGCAPFDPTTVPPVSRAITQDLTLPKVHAAVVSAALSRGWAITKDESGELDLFYKNQAIHVSYTTKSVTIRQTGGDREVTGWINGLSKEITNRLYSAAL
jgi:hypothetical protein